MYHTTGFTKAEITGLCARIEARELSPRMRRWPPILGLRNALTATLTYMRRNRVQAEIAENYGVSQPTISRAISAITPLLVQALDYVPTAHELDAGTCYIVDGTLLPCWSWRAHPELYSGNAGLDWGAYSLIRFCKRGLPNVRFAPKAPELLRRDEMSRRAAIKHPSRPALVDSNARNQI